MRCAIVYEVQKFDLASVAATLNADPDVNVGEPGRQRGLRRKCYLARDTKT